MFRSAGELLLPGLLDRLAAVPGITLETCDEDVSQDDFAALTADHDVVVAHRSGDVEAPARPRIDVRLLLREPLDVALPLDHPLAGCDRVSPLDVIGEEWIAPPAEFPINRVLSAIALLPRHSTRDRAEGRLALVLLADLRAGRIVEALARPDKAARRGVRTVLDELEASAYAT